MVPTLNPKQSHYKEAALDLPLSQPLCSVHSTIKTVRISHADVC